MSWQAPPGVRAECTVRTGGVSVGSYSSLNLGTHVGDELGAVTENRRRVRDALKLPEEPHWLSQVHGAIESDADKGAKTPKADGAIARQRGRVLAIQVADCMPVLLSSEDGAVVAAAHAGWRGLSGGVLEATVKAMQVSAKNVCAWLGPAIGPKHFEVGEEVRAAFMAQDARSAGGFTENERGRWQCDLVWLARLRLERIGVDRIDAANVCTFEDSQRCFSFRRDGVTGRMAALIWRC